VRRYNTFGGVLCTCKVVDPILQSITPPLDLRLPRLFKSVASSIIANDCVRSFLPNDTSPCRPCHRERNRTEWMRNEVDQSDVEPTAARSRSARACGTKSQRRR
jgi:hypothetical protein